MTLIASTWRTSRRNAFRLYEAVTSARAGTKRVLHPAAALTSRSPTSECRRRLLGNQERLWGGHLAAPAIFTGDNMRVEALPFVVVPCAPTVIIPAFSFTFAVPAPSAVRANRSAGDDATFSQIDGPMAAAPAAPLIVAPVANLLNQGVVSRACICLNDRCRHSCTGRKGAEGPA